jgi:ribosome-associated translation inhibitor RaiA
MAIQLKNSLRNNFFYVDFPRSEVLENFAAQKFSNILQKFHLSQDLVSRVWFQMENSPTHPGKDKFSCEVLVVSSEFKKPLFIKKSADNLYEAVTHVAHVLRNKISRLHSKVRDRKKLRYSRRNHKNGVCLPEF